MSPRFVATSAKRTITGARRLFGGDELLRDRYVNATELRWLQEEPENMGAWKFVAHHVWAMQDHGYDLQHVARVESGSPATGSKTVHDQEHADLMDGVFEGL